MASKRLRTMGVSSWHSVTKSARSSVRTCVGAFWYATANTPHDDTRDVNHSPVANRCTAQHPHPSAVPHG